MTLRITPFEHGRRSSLGPVFFGLMLLAAYAIAYPGVFIGSETFFCRDYGSCSTPWPNTQSARFCTEAFRCGTHTA